MSDFFLELQNKSAELKDLMKQHDNKLDNYVRSIQSNSPEIALEHHKDLEEINSQIDNTIMNIKHLDSKLSREDKSLDTSVFVGNEVTGASQKLVENKKRIAELTRKLKSSIGLNANTALETRSLRLKYMLICVLMIIVGILTIRAFAFKPSMIDTIFLVTAVLLGGFHFFNKQV